MIYSFKRSIYEKIRPKHQEMSQPTPSTSISLSVWVFYYLGPLPISTSCSPFYTMPCSLLQTFLQFTCENAEHLIRSIWRRAELKPLICTYATTSTFGFAADMLAQITTRKAELRLVLGSNELPNRYFWAEFSTNPASSFWVDKRARRAELISWKYRVFKGIFYFLVDGIIEETTKYLPILYARRCGIAQQRQQRNRAYIDYGLAGTLSFAPITDITALIA